jgi:excisionase family DNA binding protein
VDVVPADSRIAYSVADVCKETGLGRTQVYEQLAAGRLKAVKAGRRTLIPRESLVNFINSLPAYEPQSRADAA